MNISLQEHAACIGNVSCNKLENSMAETYVENFLQPEQISMWKILWQKRLMLYGIFVLKLIATSLMY